MASRIAKPQSDQKKVYMDWVNHQLRKSKSDMVVSDLKDISEGNCLPKVIQAVVPGPIPGLHAAVSSDAERCENVEMCIKYLQNAGVSCSSFSAKDVSDGNMRAILSLFYNLSQFKRPGTANKTASNSATVNNNKTATVSPPSTTPSAPSSTTSEPAAPVPRPSRPISPGLKSSFGLNPQKSSSSPASSSSSSSASSSQPGHTPSPASMRRTAGSSILTTTTYDKPYSNRRVPYKSGTGGALANGIATKALLDGEILDILDDSSASETSLSSGVSNSTPVRSIPAPSTSHSSPSSTSTTAAVAAAGSDKQVQLGKSVSSPHIGASKLQAPGSRKDKAQRESTKPAVATISENNERPPSRLKHPGSGRSTPSLSAVKSTATPPSSQTAASPGQSAGPRGSSLVRSSSRLAKPSSHSHLPHSEAKQSSIVSTSDSSSADAATGSSKSSGLAAPKSSLLHKQNHDSHHHHLEQGRAESPRQAEASDKHPPPSSSSSLQQRQDSREASPRPESRLKLQRKPSDGSSKRHRILQHPSGHAVIESGTTSLPRHLPRGVLGTSGGAPGSGLKLPSGVRKEAVAGGESKASDLDRSGSSTGDDESSKTSSGEHSTTATAAGEGSSAHRRGLKKPTNFTSAAGGVRTPNLPSGPHQSSAESTMERNAPSADKPATKSPTTSGLKMPSGSKLTHFSSSQDKDGDARGTPSPHHSKLQRLVPRNNTPTASSSSSSSSSVPTAGSVSLADVSSSAVSKLQRREASTSTSSLESFASSDIKLAESSNIDDAASCLTAKGVPDTKYTTPERSLLPPSSLEISQSAASSTSDLLSPPSDFKDELSVAGSHDSLIGSHDKGDDVRRYGRRISPEGMSHEEVTSPKDSNESSKKAAERNLKNEQETERSKELNMIIGDLNSHSKPKTDDTSTTTTTAAVVPSSDSDSQNENETSKQDQPESATTVPSSDSSSPTSIHSEAISQPETGQRYTMENMAQFKKPAAASVESSPPQQQSSKEGSSIFSPRKIESSPGSRRNKGLTETYPLGSRSSRISQASTDIKSKNRARSLSPQRTHRIKPKTRVQVPTNHVSHGLLDIKRAELDLARTASNDSTKSENLSVRKPLKSSLRNTSLNPKSRNSSSSSLESGKCLPKVTISPRSSQLVYDPEEIGLQPPLSYAYNSSRLSPTPNISPDRPHSLTESAASSDSFSPPGSTNVLFPPSVVVSRKRSTLSEKLDYRDEFGLLGDSRKPQPDEFSSTPQLLETFENQLSNMQKDIESKDRMLSMYESSMADLSSKVHHLRKTLEEKDLEIKHLTLSKNTWYDLEGRSLASRASEGGVLSDGCLSDSAMESDEKRGKKKKKPWKRFSFRSKKKDGHETMSLSPNMDAESVISARSTKSLKRSNSKRKATDLMSISEYIPSDSRYKDLDTKSTYTLDARSEFAASLPLMMAHEESITVYEDCGLGAKANVLLQPDCYDFHGNDSGYHGDVLASRHSSGRDSLSSEDSSSHGNGDESETGEIVLGVISIAPEHSWVTMDTKIADVFMHHLVSVDPEGALGLNDEAIAHYYIGEQRRQIGNALLPLVTPYQALGANGTVRIIMKGAAQESCDSLAYKSLMGSEALQSYMEMLKQTRCLVVMGTKGTCKTSLATGLAKHLAHYVNELEDDEMVGGGVTSVVTFNIDKDGLNLPLKYMKTELAMRIQHQLQPPIILLDGIYECKDLEQVLVAAGALSRRPYIISTLCSGTTKGVPLHQLLFHHQIRVITCNPQTEPIVGILSRSLRKQVFNLKASAHPIDPIAERMVNWLPYLLEHLNTLINKFHSNTVNLGPRVFMGCPLTQSAGQIETWFINLWNHFIIPYLMGTIMAGIETYTADPRLEWIDVREWVVETYPWQPSMNVNKLKTVTPDDVGWNHAVRPQQRGLMIIKDDEDTRSVLRIA